MSINIDLGAWNSIFAVPSKVVDEGLKFSDGVKLKVLLFVLRNAGHSVDDTEISKATGVNVTDIPEALDYWVSMGVFNRIENTFTPVKNNEEFVSAPQTPAQTEQTPQPVQTVLQPQQTVSQPVQAVQEPVKQETEQSPKENAEEPQKHFTVTRPQKPDFVFTAQRLAVDEELKMLVEETQTTLGKVLSNSDIATLLMLKDTCGLPLDVIFMLYIIVQALIRAISERLKISVFNGQMTVFIRSRRLITRLSRFKKQRQTFQLFQKHLDLKMSVLLQKNSLNTVTSG